MHLFVDGKNATYRAVYASHKNDGSAFNYLIRQVSSWISRFNATKVHVFWDAPRAEVWRRTIHSGYKNREGNEYIENVSDDINKTIAIAKSMFSVMGIRQYYKNCMEADDLIYAAVNVLYPDDITIVSTDGDMAQIIFKHKHVQLFNPGNAKLIDIPEIDPVYMKILTGDKSDTIDGFKGIGDIRAADLIKSRQKFHQFYVDNIEKFKTNMMLVDLSVCPYLMINKLYCMKVLASDVTYDNKLITNVCKEYKITSYLLEHKNYASNFKGLT